jgi:cyanophycin synthetase
VAHAEKGSLIVLCSDVVPDALDLVKYLKDKEANGELT